MPAVVSAKLLVLLGFTIIPMLALAADPTNVAGIREKLKRELDRRARRNEKPFAPAHNSTLKVNPPAFVWLPLRKRPRDYLLALSRSLKFPEDATMIFKAPISVHIPTKPLEPEQWHWRVGVRLPDKSVAWSKTRSYKIAADADEWPFPEMDSLVAKIPQKHPRLLFPGDELERARAHCRKTMGREYARLLRAAKRCIGKPLVDEPSYIRVRGPQRGRLYRDIFRATRPPMNEMEMCALAYLLSGERRLGDEAKRRLLHFLSWDPNGPTSLFHNDEPAMWLMQRGTRAYDWAYDLFTPAERKKIEPVMKVRCQQFLRRLTRMPFESRPYSSHAARDLGFLGEAAMCFIHEWPEARNWLEYTLKIYWSVFPAWAQEDGGWQEGPGYWGAYMSFALHFAAALKKATGAEITRKPFFRNTPYYKLYTNPPFARMSPFGDGQHGGPGRGSGHLMYHFSTLLRDPCVRWYSDVQKAGPGSGPLGFALVDPGLEAKPPVDLPQARVFPGAGLVAMHTNLADPESDAYLVMRSSPFGSISHGHADQNAFCIEAFGEALAIASGYYPWYGSPHHRNWTRETKAKNCITIDGGKGQSKRSWNASGRIVRFLHGQAYDYALGDATPAYSGRLKRFLRHVIHVRPGTFIIIDEVEAPKPVALEWWLHALEEMKIDKKKREVLVRRGGARLLATFIEPRGLNFTQTDRFDPPPEDRKPNQWHLTATLKSRSTGAIFLTVLRPHRAKDEGKLPSLRRIAEGEVAGVGWAHRGVEHRILFGRKGIHAEGVGSDGAVVALRAQDGRPSGWLVVGGTTLALNGKALFTSEKAATITWPAGRK